MDEQRGGGCLVHDDEGVQQRVQQTGSSDDGCDRDRGSMTTWHQWLRGMRRAVVMVVVREMMGGCS